MMEGSASNDKDMRNKHGIPVQSDAPVDTLCSSCQQLNLSIQKFVPSTATDSILPGFLATPVDIAGLQRLDLGYLDEIYRRRDRCSFCYLIFQGTHTPESHYLGLDGLTEEGKRLRCHIDWQLDGRHVEDSKLDQKHRPPTRRMRVFSPEGHWTDTHIMLMSSEVPSLAQPSFLARKASSSTVDPDLLKEWLRICKESHNCASDESMGFTERLRFIDLDQESLIGFTEGKARVAEYATLSYVWGRYAQFVLSTSNYLSLTLPGALSPRTRGLPSTIRDAMLLVKAIGLRYLWIDAICIIQDSSEDKSRIIPLMDKIFRNGTVNICAASGSDSREGIRGSTGTPRASNNAPVVKCAGLNLMTTKTVESRIDNTTWSSRAWVFQERMLSTRSLIFVSNCAFFQCSQATWSEEVCSESPVPTWTLEMVGSPFESVGKNPVRLYLQYVELFSEKDLTFSGDRLNAFLGVMTMLQPLLGTSFLYGLPTAYFDLALLWESRSEGCQVADDSFPSWSWCGRVVSCVWRLSMISGLLLDLHEWFLSHTWVVWWHLPGQDGMSGPNDSTAVPRSAPFQLVWSSSQHKPGTVSPRWQGYVPADGSYYGRHLSTTDGGSTPIVDSNSRPVYPTSTLRKSTVLYFWTYTAFFQLSRQSRTDPTFASKLETGLHRFSLMDSNGDWCGTIVLKESFFSSVGDILEFAAISDARDFSMEELDTWNYYVPEDREVSEWQLYYALLIVWNEDHTVAERVGLAKIYKRAYDVASFEPGKEWREIVLG